MKRIQLAALVFVSALAQLVFAGGSSIVPDESGLPSGGGAAGDNINIGDGCWLDDNGVQCLTRLTDAAAEVANFTAQSALPGALINTAGANTNLAGGLGTMFVAMTAANCAGDTITVSIDGTATVGTEGVEFACATTDAACATSVAAWIDSLTGVDSCGNTACTDFAGTSGTVYVYKAITEPGALTVGVATGDATCAGISAGTAGIVRVWSVLSVPLGTAAAPGLYFGADTNTGLYSTADVVGVTAAGTGRVQVDANGLSMLSGDLMPLPGATGNPSLSATTDTNTGAWWDASDGLYIANNATDNWMFEADGELKAINATAGYEGYYSESGMYRGTMGADAAAPATYYLGGNALATAAGATSGGGVVIYGGAGVHTITISDYTKCDIPADTVIVATCAGRTTLTPTAGAPGANQWQCATGNNETAASLEAAIEAVAGLTSSVSGAVVSIGLEPGYGCLHTCLTTWTTGLGTLGTNSPATVCNANNTASASGIGGAPVTIATGNLVFGLPYSGGPMVSVGYDPGGVTAAAPVFFFGTYGSTTYAAQVRAGPFYSYTTSGVAVNLANTGLVGWASSGAPTGTKDTGISRNTAGVLSVDNGISGGTNYFQFDGPGTAALGNTAGVYTMQSGQTTGTNQAGTTFAAKAGAGTGTGAAGDIKLQTTIEGTTGTTVQSAVSRFLAVGSPITVTDAGGAETILTLTIPSLSYADLKCSATIQCNDGTDICSHHSQLIDIAAVASSAGTTVADCGETVGPAPEANSAGCGGNITATYACTAGAVANQVLLTVDSACPGVAETSMNMTIQCQANASAAMVIAHP